MSLLWRNMSQNGILTDSKCCSAFTGRGARRNFLRGGAEILRNILLPLKYRLPYLLKNLCHICCFNFNTSTLFLTRSSRDVCLSLPVFPRYRDFVNLLKYDATQCGTSLQNFDIVYGSL